MPLNAGERALYALFFAKRLPPKITNKEICEAAEAAFDAILDVRYYLSYNVRHREDLSTNMLRDFMDHQGD
jgi:hypothetical protein